MRTGSKIKNPSMTVHGESRELQLYYYTFTIQLFVLSQPCGVQVAGQKGRGSHATSTTRPGPRTGGAVVWYFVFDDLYDILLTRYGNVHRSTRSWTRGAREV